MPGKKIKEGKRYRAISGSSVAGQEGVCIETWETGFGHKFLKLRTATGVHSMRTSCVERIKD